MLPRINRLFLRTELKRLKSEGRLIQGRFFSLILSLTGSTPRFAFVVSKKIDQRATRRNRIRRLMSEAVRQLLPEIKPGTEAIFFVKRAIIDQNLDEIKSEIKKSLS